jgi:3-oxoacyl-[acyl-carrier protein] reductase
MRLDGKVAIVTGAGSGIGEGIAKRFAAEGAKVLVADIAEAGGRRVADEIGGAARFHKADVTRSDDVKAMVEAAVATFGRLDIVASNAGYTHPRTDTQDMDEATWDRVFAINLKSIFHAVRHAAPVLAAQGGGVLLNTASTSGLKPRPGNTVYATSKAAVIAFTKSLAVELAPQRIRVNCFLPVASDTPMLRAFAGEGNNAIIQDMASRIPLGRLGTPEDMAAAAVFLCSDEAAFFTGVALPVDGGWTAG